MTLYDIHTNIKNNPARIKWIPDILNYFTVIVAVTFLRFGLSSRSAVK